mmetsp:Transcript_10455/g.15641  ORF Transcript_10455/g.15641 Transcript_10455/m.15641 type:complete len:217 (-) Transcript_10455:1826-2476(-)
MSLRDFTFFQMFSSCLFSFLKVKLYTSNLLFRLAITFEFTCIALIVLCLILSFRISFLKFSRFAFSLKASAASCPCCSISCFFARSNTNSSLSSFSSSGTFSFMSSIVLSFSWMPTSLSLRFCFTSATCLASSFSKFLLKSSEARVSWLSWESSVSWNEAKEGSSSSSKVKGFSSGFSPKFQQKKSLSLPALNKSPESFEKRNHSTLLCASLTSEF